MTTRAMALAAALLVAARADAQTGAYMTPRLGVEGVYDDNIYEGGEHPGMYYTRLRPTFAVGWDGDRLDVAARYAYAADLFGFTLTPERRLDSHQIGGEAAIRSTRRLTLGADGFYLDARYGYTAAGAGFETGVERRMRTLHGVARPYFAYELASGTLLNGNYLFMREEQGSVRSLMHEARAGLAHSLSPADRGLLDLSARQLTFDDGSEARSAALLVGWEHRVSRLASLSAAAGPRLTGSEVDVEARFSVRRADRLSSIAVQGARLQTTIPGRIGAMRTTMGGVRASRELWRTVTLSLAPSYYDTRGADYEARVLRLDTSLLWPVNEWLALTATYQLSRQWFFIGHEDAPAAGEVDHTLMSIGIAFGSPDPIRI